MGSKLVRSKLDQGEWKDPELKKFLRPVHDRFEYERLLTQKLLEEVGELIGASDEDLLEEAADVLEVLHTIVRRAGYEPKDLRMAAHDKAEKFGDFDSNLVWEM